MPQKIKQFIKKITADAGQQGICFTHESHTINKKKYLLIVLDKNTVQAYMDACRVMKKLATKHDVKGIQPKLSGCYIFPPTAMTRQWVSCSHQEALRVRIEGKSFSVPQEAVKPVMTVPSVVTRIVTSQLKGEVLERSPLTQVLVEHYNKSRRRTLAASARS